MEPPEACTSAVFQVRRSTLSGRHSCSFHVHRHPRKYAVVHGLGCQLGCQRSPRSAAGDTSPLLQPVRQPPQRLVRVPARAAEVVIEGWPLGEGDPHVIEPPKSGYPPSERQGCLSGHPRLRESTERCHRAKCKGIGRLPPSHCGCGDRLPIRIGQAACRPARPSQVLAPRCILTTPLRSSSSRRALGASASSCLGGEDWTSMSSVGWSCSSP